MDVNVKLSFVPDLLELYNQVSFNS